MKTKLLSFLLLFASIILISNSNGVTTIQNLDRTGSPVSTSACNTCHGGGNYNPTLDIALKDLSGNIVDTYQPDSVYRIEFQFGGDTPARYGYQATALLSSDNSQAGSIEAANSDSKIVSLNNRDYADHNGLVTSNTFILEWTAPSQGAGAVGFYASGIAANGSGTSGDSPVTAEALIIGEDGNSEEEDPEEEDPEEENPEEEDPTSINSLTKNNFNIYPNPAQDFLKINFSQDKIFNLKVMNQEGKLIIFDEIHEVNKPLNVSLLSNGLYFLEFHDKENKVYFNKFIKK